MGAGGGRGRWPAMCWTPAAAWAAATPLAVRGTTGLARGWVASAWRVNSEFTCKWGIINHLFKTFVSRLTENWAWACVKETMSRRYFILIRSLH